MHKLLPNKKNSAIPRPWNKRQPQLNFLYKKRFPRILLRPFTAENNFHIFKGNLVLGELVSLLFFALEPCYRWSCRLSSVRIFLALRSLYRHMNSAAQSIC